MRGFSLVELSIVLVILGLLTGGILAGQNLIRASEMRAITSEFNRYQTAVYTFRDKYFALPGDMPNAIDFWTAADGGDGVGTDCRQAISTGTETCNGDGDGRIVDTNFSQETWRAWQHLANAGLIEGSFSGTREASATTWQPVSAFNVPPSKNTPSMWAFCKPSARQYSQGDKLRLIHANSTGISSNECSMRQSAGLTPAEVWGIDTKSDDGIASSGKVLALGGFITSATVPCVTGSNSAPALDADYRLDESGRNCLIHFVIE